MIIPSLTQLENCLIRDRHRLRQRHVRLAQKRDVSDELHQQWIQWQQTVDVSRKVADERGSSVPLLTYDPDLPITKHREEIVQLIKDRQTLVLCGETGSGKSTQLPKLCLEAGRGKYGIIGHTQPRRLAARSVATRIAQELNSKLGELVGYKIRFNDQTSPRSLIKLMTDGILLAETPSDRFLDNYDTLIIDEAHERSLNIDFLLGYLHQLRAKRPDLKLIITSATIDAERFASHFEDELGPAPIIEVSGRGYPVEVRYRPLTVNENDDEEQDADGEDPLSGVVSAVDELLSESAGDILVFLPTERDIREGSRRLRGHFTRRSWNERFEILPLYARLTEGEQQRIFQSHDRLRIVLATNVAESSLTVPGIRNVIDTGTARISRYAPKSKVQRLPIEPIARAAADQRAGRCGRTAPGICIRLFSEEDYKSRPRFTTPEIRRTDLAAVILQTKILQLGELDEFPLLDAPQPEMIRDAYRTLHELGAIDDHRRLTEIGKRLGRLPVEPRVGRMILAAEDNHCLAEVLIIAAALECQDVRVRPADQQGEADAQHAKFQDPWSDFFSYLRLWDFYHELREKHGSSRMQKILRSNYLSFHAFREWSDIQRQLRETLTESGLKIPPVRLRLEPLALAKNEPKVADHQERRKGKEEFKPDKRPERPAEYEPIHRSLLTGLLSGIAQRSEKGEYAGADQVKMFLWPGSGLQAHKPTWIVSAEIVETSRRFARIVAEIDPSWIEVLAQHVVKRSYSDPHWSAKSQSAMVYERVTLFGLPIVVGRRVPLAPIEPQLARELLIEKGLVEGELQTSAAFVKHNRGLLAACEDLAHRTRQREYVIDPYLIIRFYHEHLPQEITDRISLEKWDRLHRPNPKSDGAAQRSAPKTYHGELLPTPTDDAPAVWMRPVDLLGETVDVPNPNAFPDRIQIGATQLPVSYHFEPGSERDGIGVRVPAILVPQLSEDRMGWMVEGLLEEKLLAMIRALPKQLRRNLVPGPDVAKWIAAKMREDFAKKPFLPLACHWLSEKGGELIRPEHFEGERLPDHLRMRLEVVDDKGKVVAQGRDIEKLKEEICTILPRELKSVMPAAGGAWQRQGLTDLDVDQIPESIVVERGGLKITLFPALLDEGETVAWTLVDNREEAIRQSMYGWMRLFAIKEKREIRKQLAHFPNWSKITLHATTWLTGEKLQRVLGDVLVRRAFLDKEKPIHSKAEFQKRTQEATRRISIAVQEMATWLPLLFERYHQVRLKLEEAPQPWQEATADMRDQLKGLLGEKRFVRTPWKWLQHYPRFLQAIIHRFEKLRTGGPAKDRALMLQVHTYWKDCKTRLETTEILTEDSPLENYRWMIEEYRVSLFAQSLGTSAPVSEKRIAAIAAQLKL